MYILKNAWKTIIRNKGRNILIGIIVLVISCSCAVALAIRSTSNKLIESYENKYDVVASISVNRQNMMQNFDPSKQDNDDLIDSFNEISSLSIEEIEKYAESKYVSSYYYTYSVGLNGSNIDPATTQKITSVKGGGMSISGGMRQDKFPGASNADFRVEGYSSLEAMTEFISGSYTISEGEISFAENTCVINEELATLNEISVGDTIKLKDDNSKTYTLTVTGIYKENSETTDAMNMFSHSVNSLITSTATVEGILAKNSDLSSSITPSFILTDKDAIEPFQEELYGKGMNENLVVSTNLDQVEGATSTISNVSSFAITFLVIVLIIGSIVLLVINAINIRERKYEIGVLRTIGMKKSTLAFQFMIELILVSSFALAIGAAIGASISVSVSNNLLSSEIESSKNETENIGKNFGGNGGPSFTRINGINNIQAFDSIDAAVDLKVLLELLGIGLGLTILSSLASIINIQKFSPLTILKERS